MGWSAFASFAPELLDALQVYRDNFQPSAQLRPYAMAGERVRRRQ